MQNGRRLFIYSETRGIGQIMLYCCILNEKLVNALGLLEDTYNVPRMAFINKMDILGANFYGAVDQIEFLVSKAGLGYLIVYGGQVFQLDLVMASVVILAIVSALMYQGVC